MKVSFTLSHTLSLFHSVTFCLSLRFPFSLSFSINQSHQLFCSLSFFLFVKNYNKKRDPAIFKSTFRYVLLSLSSLTLSISKSLFFSLRFPLSLSFHYILSLLFSCSLSLFLPIFIYSAFSLLFVKINK